MNEDRRKFLGGSDIAPIFNVSQWKSAYDLWEEKTAPEFIAPEIEPKREKLFRRGKKLEPWIMELLEEEQGIFINKRNQRYQDEEYSWMTAEVDFEFMAEEGECNGEAKTVSPFAAKDWGESETDEIPLGYCLQAMWGLMITKRPMTMVAPLIGADDLRVYRVKRDEELIAAIRQKAVQFWTGHVVPKIPPPAVTVSDVHKVLFKYGGFPIAWDDSLGESLRKLRETKAAAKELKGIQEEIELEIKRSLLVKAEAAGLTDTPKKFVMNDVTGKRLASFSYEHRAGYAVKETDYWILRS